MVEDSWRRCGASPVWAGEEGEAGKEEEEPGRSTRPASGPPAGRGRH